ncbi:MAG: nucleoside hydrolase [Chloroflexi bacterium]|nr:nucleoside hydrolase [Chloroflexota bacterium]
MPQTPSRPSVIVDCDPGHDDVFAMVVANHYATLLGITVVHGNAPLSRTLPNTLISCGVFGISAPVFAGAERPLIAPPRNAPHIHGESGLGGPELPPVTRTAEKTHAVEAIIELVRKHEGDGVWLMPLGPLTNIALALRMAPDLGKRIAGISLMGGGTLHGNRAPHAEFNIWADPEAASVVFNYGGPLKMVGLNTTHQVVITKAFVERVAALKTRKATFAAELLDFFSTTYGEQLGVYGGPLHDPCAVFAVTHPQLFDLRPKRVDIELYGEFTRGMTAVDERPIVASKKGEPNALVAYEPKSAEIFDLIYAAVAADSAPA